MCIGKDDYVPMRRVPDGRGQFNVYIIILCVCFYIMLHTT